MKTTLLFALVVLSITTKVRSQEDFQTSRVTIFKNGIALIEKTANLHLNGNTAIINTIPFKAINSQNNNVSIGTVQFTSPINEIIETRFFPNYVKLIFENDNPVQKVDLSYVQAGIAWIPNYLIQLQDDGTAMLKLDVTLLNEIEDIKEANFNFAIGVPYFPYAKVNSPLAHNNDIFSLQNSIYNQLPVNYLNNIVNVGYGAIKRSDLGSSGTIASETPEWNEDLFFYPKNNLSLLRNEKLKLNILKTKISYIDIYSVEISGNSDIVNQHGFNSNLKKSKNIVKHSFRFKNNTDYPLTSGIVHFQSISNNQIRFISQSILEYTNSNSLCEIVMAVTPEIVVTDNEKEVKRQNVNGYYELSIKSEIVIENHKSETIEVVIKRDVLGNLIESNKTWEIHKIPANNYRNNESNHVEWKLRIPANGKEKITYSYLLLI